MYRLRGDLAVVNTVDFFPPIVDDPYTYGRIAAANSLSDVYAMGARPIVALNVVAFPTKKLPLSVLADILAGGAERVAAAGAVIGGGHSVCDDRTQIRACGYRHRRSARDRPQRWRAKRRRAGSHQGASVPAFSPPASSAAPSTPAEEHAAVESMVALNDVAGAALVEFRARACTDVTGFGLAGHAAEVALASEGVRLVFDSGAISLLPGTARLAEAGMLTGGGRAQSRLPGSTAGASRDVPPVLVEPPW